MNTAKKPKYLGIAGVILFLMIFVPIFSSFNIISSNFSEQNQPSPSPPGVIFDYVDFDIGGAYGDTIDFGNMQQDNEAFAMLVEGRPLPWANIFYLEQIYRFDAVDLRYEIAELHFELHEPPRIPLRVYIGNPPSASQLIGQLDRPGDQSFNIKPFLTTPTLFVRIVDTYGADTGPYLIERMYLLMTGMNTPPNVDAGLDQYADEGNMVGFSGSFTDPDISDTHSIEWDFGDGSTEVGTLTPTHVYGDNNIYTVTLTVRDNKGGIGQDTQTVTIHNIAPVVEAGPDQMVNERELAFFSGQFVDQGYLDTHTTEWDFGDGTTESGTLTPTHHFGDNGVFLVRLTITDDDGGVGSDTLLVTVNNMAPIVTAKEDQVTQEGTEISLILASFTNEGEFDTHTALIDWGDGTIEPGVVTEPTGPVMLFMGLKTSDTGEGTVSGTHTYGDNGIYNVIITVTDDDGGMGSDSLIITVNNVAPLVDAGEDQVVNEGEIVNFGGAFVDPGQDIHIIEWNFGDGSTETGTLTPTHVYRDNGIYSVSLTVTDDDGGFDSDNLVVTVNNIAPVVDAGEDEVVDEGELISFRGSFIDPGQDIHTIEWDFGDGFNDIGTLTPTHTYRDNGVYLVTLTITDDDGGTDSDTLIVTVINVDPLVIAGDDHITDEGSMITFHGSFTDPGTLDTHTIEWDFGDGSITSDTLTPFHSYEDNGIYTVILTIIDDDGGVGTDILIVTVNNVAPTVNAGEDYEVNEGDIVNFDGEFSDPGDQDSHSIEWAFGDDTTMMGTLNPTHAYADNGVYTVTLTVTDDDGGVGVDVLIVTVNNVAPLVEIGDDHVTNEGSMLTFHGSFTDPGILDTHTVEWNFGDGSTASGVLSPSHIYKDNGFYTVTLTVIDNDGEEGVDSLTVTVNNVAPIAEAGDDQEADEGNVLSFLGSFTDPGILDTHTVEWDFGDGSIITGTLAPSHTYGDNGLYAVTLTIIDDDGDIGSDSLTVTINNLAPTVFISDIIQLSGDINATGIAFDPGSDDLTFIWGWSDGTDDKITNYINDPPVFPFQIEETVEHMYTTAGVFIITLIVIDDDGGMGTDSVTVEVLNPRDMKFGALLDLEQLKTGDKSLDKKIDLVIKFVEFSLCEELWIDSNHLDPQKGSLVFTFEMIAVKLFEKFLLDDSNEFIVHKLVKADEILAEIALEEAQNAELINSKFRDKYERYLFKAEKHFNEALNKFEAEKYLCSMYHFLKSWKYAQRAIKWANKIASCCICSCKC